MGKVMLRIWRFGMCVCASGLFCEEGFAVSICRFTAFRASFGGCICGSRLALVRFRIFTVFMFSEGSGCRFGVFRF